MRAWPLVILFVGCAESNAPLKVPPGIVRDYDLKTITVDGEVHSRGERGVVRGRVELREFKQGSDL